MRPPLLLLALAACWTGPDPAPTETLRASAPAPRPKRPLEVTLERTPCMGACPTYRVTITGDGTVMWRGLTNVNTRGERRARVAAHQLAELDRAIERAHFFELDESGHLPMKPTCVRTGNTLTCSMSSVSVCSDTSHAVITVRRGTQLGHVDNAHCSDESTELTKLEDTIDRISGSLQWIGW